MNDEFFEKVVNWPDSSVKMKLAILRVNRDNGNLSVKRYEQLVNQLR